MDGPSHMRTQRIHTNTAKGPAVPTMVNSLVSTNGKSVSHRIAAEGTLQRRRKGRRGTAFRCPLRSKDSNCEYLVFFFSKGWNRFFFESSHSALTTENNNNNGKKIQELPWGAGSMTRPSPATPASKVVSKPLACDDCYDSLETLKTNHQPAIPDCWLPTISS